MINCQNMAADFCSRSGQGALPGPESSMDGSWKEGTISNVWEITHLSFKPPGGFCWNLVKEGRSGFAQEWNRVNR